ncbi:MAG: hypothetical protein JWM53_5864 [bacterium]|nr:hypothetical protein [bacterium]
MTVEAVKTNLPVRQEFGALQQMEKRHETAASAVAAQAKAVVEARYVIALQRPRNWDQVRQDLLKECRRPSFAANKSAFYRKPIGQGVEGLGIRFAEVALRCMTNVMVETSMVYEDTDKEIHRVCVTDLEANLTYPMDVTVRRTVERSKPMDDGSYISVRMNSYNKPVYTVPANDDDLLNKRGALLSKAVRTLALRIIPGDLQDEAEEIIKAVRLDEAAKDPDAERKKISDAFGALGVKVSDLETYLGHKLDTCTPPELVDLRGLYGALKDGEATWKSVMENKDAEDSAGGAPEPKAKAGKGVEAAKAKIKEGGEAVDKGTGEIKTDAKASTAPEPAAWTAWKTKLAAAKNSEDLDYLRSTAKEQLTDEQQLDVPSMLTRRAAEIASASDK